jgi:hypothetical protein
MPRIPRHEYLGFPEGIMNRSMLRNSPSGEVKTYYLTEEERLAVIEKYGPILIPRKRAKQSK